MDNINPGQNGPNPAAKNDGQEKEVKPINLGDITSLPKAAPTPAAASSGSFSKPDSISINFTPKMAEPVKPAGTEAPKVPQLISMEIKREDLKKEDLKEAPAVAAAPEKKGFLGGLFGKKPEVTQSKPSSAWGGALDVPKDTKPSTPAATAKPMEIAASKPADSAMPKVGTAPAIQPAEKKDFFTSAALQEKSGSSKLMENIVTQKTQLEQPKIEDLLGKKSTILEKSIEQESQLKMKKKLRVMQFMALMIALVVIGVNGYLYYQLSPGINLLGYINYNFDSNLRNDIFNLNQSLKSVQTESNKYHYLTGQLYLNQFGYESTRFMDGVANYEAPGLASDKNVIESVITEAKTNMPTMLEGAKANLSLPIAVDTYQTRGEDQVDPSLRDVDFQKMLRQSIADEKQSKIETNTQGNLDVPASSLAFYDNASKLVGNKKLMDGLKASTVEALKLDAEDYQKGSDPAQRTKFRNYIDDLLASTKVNLATISELRNSRILWKDVIDRIEKITNTVNSEHNSGVSAANESIITYSNFDLNAETGKVSVTGTNTTRSGTNREVITFLIQAFEAAPEFKNVVDRSFPLAKSTDLNGQTLYTMNFKMDMDLEKGAFSKLNEPIADLGQGQKVAVVKVPVKRNK